MGHYRFTSRLRFAESTACSPLKSSCLFWGICATRTILQVDSHPFLPGHMKCRIICTHLFVIRDTRRFSCSEQTVLFWKVEQEVPLRVMCGLTPGCSAESVAPEEPERWIQVWKQTVGGSDPLSSSGRKHSPLTPTCPWFHHFRLGSPCVLAPAPSSAVDVAFETWRLALIREKRHKKLHVNPPVTCRDMEEAATSRDTHTRTHTGRVQQHLSGNTVYSWGTLGLFGSQDSRV